MKLGCHSISLAVKDIRASKAFYEKLGFTMVHGDLDKNHAIMDNNGTKIGLFQGMFDTNTLTFNPGWDQDGNPVEGGFEDVRAIQKSLKAAGLKLELECDENGSGPAHCFLFDPDGNPVLIDQHV
ncbi:MAG: VOC family protein [Planctomycetota bacterium]